MNERADRPLTGPIIGPDVRPDRGPNKRPNRGARLSAHGSVRILMATYNGAAYLPDQLNSFIDQHHDDWTLLVGDDGSRDSTPDLVNSFAAAHPERGVRMMSGPGQGSAANFLTLAAEGARPGLWMAFSDQDDVWMPHKLGRAQLMMRRRLRDLAGEGSDAPLPPVGDAVIAYASRLYLTDAEMKFTGVSPHMMRPPGFANALVQNILGGNSMVLSPAAAALVARSVPAALAADVPFHDWWIYLLIAGAGGTIVFDRRPGVFYRQHKTNVLGNHGGMRGRMARLGMLANRHYSDWLSRNLAGLAGCAELLTPESRTLFTAFAAARQGRRRTCLAALDNLGIYRQTDAGDRMLRLLARTGRL